MPFLQFKGKSFVQNHHLAVPYHQLVPQKDKSLTEKVSLHDNLIVHGDNLLALKALLPTYAGKVKCIYIDPPYNTGNEQWKYNDNVTSPLIKEWIGKVVGKEGEDFTRHDKWLCMMMPRLKLLKELLSDDGVIFISVDDIEAYGLRTLMDEVFGPINHIATVVRQTIKGGTGPSNTLRQTHDYVIAYSRNSESVELAGLPAGDIELDQKDEVGPFAKGRELNKWGAGSRREDSPTMWFPIKGPKGEDVYPIRNDGTEGRWRWGKERMLKAVSDNEVLYEPRGDGTYIVYEKVRENTGRTKSHQTLFLDHHVNANGTEELKAIFNGRSPFEYPKPTSLVKTLCSIADIQNDDIVLDSFAGSGTTGQAVLAMNKEDGGNRKFILVECEDYADSITAERMRRVVKGVPSAKSEPLKTGFGGTFSYFELGDPIETEGILKGSKLPSYMELARYVYYTATGEEFDESKLDESNNFVGASRHYDVYMLYKPDTEYLKQTALTLNLARELRDKAGSRPLLVFAPTKYVESGELDELKLDFCQLPFEIYKVAK